MISIDIKPNSGNIVFVVSCSDASVKLLDQFMPYQKSKEAIIKDIQIHGQQQLIGDGPACVWSMSTVDGFSVLVCNPDLERNLDLVAKTEAKNLKVEGLMKVSLQAGSEKLFQFDSIDKSQQTKLSIKLKYS